MEGDWKGCPNWTPAGAMEKTLIRAQQVPRERLDLVSRRTGELEGTLTGYWKEFWLGISVTLAP